MKTTVAVLCGLIAVTLAGCERPPVDTTQIGYRGLAMEQVTNPRVAAQIEAANQPPPPIPPVEAAGPLAKDIYKNVQVLDDLTVPEFTRLMLAITQWVAPPDRSCAYCHEGSDLASDALYTKVVARRMIQMTRHINTDWKPHVADTGVTCFTCHRGKEVPANLWFADSGPVMASRYLGNRAGQNAPADSVGLASLPNDPNTPLLGAPDQDHIRVVSTTALPLDNRHSIKQTELTYGLMMDISQSLGVNCTHCHNSRSFAEWDGSTPQRAVAWHALRMVRDVNASYLAPLSTAFPPNRLGPHGDVGKVNCATCHQGVPKPLNGVSMLKDYPELAAHRKPQSVAQVASQADH